LGYRFTDDADQPAKSGFYFNENSGNKSGKGEYSINTFYNPKTALEQQNMKAV
jgi:hypothetical protein